MSFRKDFMWGCATASYQIEGAAYEDGKGLSVWDTFCKEPNRILGGHNGDVACDHYHRYKEDVALMKEIGLKSYRFSISWPRVMPEGTGKVNEKGLQFYENLVDALIEAGITPFVTLFHWDLPQALFERGGWLNPDMPDWFAEYTAVIAKRLGGKLKHYFTMNEPQCFVGLAFSHRRTIKAPGVPHHDRETLQMAHHCMLAHGKSVKVLRELVPDAKVGYAPTGTTFYPATDSPEDIEAARLALFDVPEDWGFCVAWYSDPVMLGSYPAKGESVFGKNMPRIKSGDLEIMHQPLDYYAQNIYHSTAVKSDGKGGYIQLPRPLGFPRTSFGWPRTPEALYWPVKLMYERYKTPVIISENGMAAHDNIALDGKVHDPDRIDYTNRYLLQLKKAAADGVDVRGYYYWSLMDNFEWEQGFHERFGLIHVDFNTQKRTLKDSAYWYKSVIESNGESL